APPPSIVVTPPVGSARAPRATRLIRLPWTSTSPGYGGAPPASRIRTLVKRTLAIRPSSGRGARAALRRIDPRSPQNETRVSRGCGRLVGNVTFCQVACAAARARVGAAAGRRARPSRANLSTASRRGDGAGTAGPHSLGARGRGEGAGFARDGLSLLSQ